MYEGSKPDIYNQLELEMIVGCRGKNDVTFFYYTSNEHHKSIA